MLHTVLYTVQNNIFTSIENNIRQIRESASRRMSAALNTKYLLRYYNFSPSVGCSEGLDAFRFFFEKWLAQQALRLPVA